MEGERAKVGNSLLDALGVDRPINSVVGAIERLGRFDHAGQKVLDWGMGEPWVYRQNDTGCLGSVGELDTTGLSIP